MSDYAALVRPTQDPRREIESRGVSGNCRHRIPMLLKRISLDYPSPLCAVRLPWTSPTPPAWRHK